MFCSVPGQSEILQTNVLQTAMTASSVTKYLLHSEQKRTSEQCHETNDVIALRLVQEVVIVKSIFYTTFYYPTLFRRVQITRETSTNITRYLYSSHSTDRAKDKKNHGESEFWGNENVA